MEKNTIQSDVIRGNINTIILKALYSGERYGYDIIKEINEVTSGQYDLKQPTLYSCLTRLESQGFIESYWGSKSNGGRRKYYSLTDLGREVFLKSQSDWEFSRTVMDRLISDKTVDLDALAKNQDVSIEEENSSENLNEVENMSDTQNNADVACNNAENIDENAMPSPVSNDIDKPLETAPIYADSANIMTQLFSQELSSTVNASYTEKLVSEKYVADRTIKKNNNYFKDFYNSNEEVPYLEQTENEPVLDVKTSENESNSFEREVINQKSIQENNINESIVPKNEFEQSAADDKVLKNNTSMAEQEKRIAEKEHFINYNENVLIKETTATSLFAREYRNILGSFVNQCFIHTKQPIANSQNENANVSAVSKIDIMSKTNESVFDEPFAQDNTEQDNTENVETTPITAYTKDNDVNKKFNKIAVDVRELGDNIKIRTANSDTSKEYTKIYHFYSNRLMLKHYAILFGIMLAEILLTSVLVFMGLKINRVGDVYYYVGAVVLALFFPTLAFIKNYIQPNKTKRINFSLKSSLIYRTIVMFQCFLIIYCYNLFFNMPLTFDIAYITTLVLPALLCTNFPVSALIFNGLFKSKKYAVD